MMMWRRPVLSEIVLDRLAEGWVFVTVDDAGAPIDRLVREDLLQFRQGILVLPLGIRSREQRGDTQRLRGAGETNDVADELSERLRIAHAEHQPHLVIDEQHDAVLRRGLFVAAPSCSLASS